MTTKGSRQYWPKRRATRRLPRIRSAPQHNGEPRLSNIIAYKMGMASMMLIDDSESPSKQQEVNRACTVLEVPSMELYGMRLYRRNGLTSYRESAVELCDKATAQRLGIKAKNDESKLQEFRSRMSDYSDITALLVASPRTTSAEQNHMERFESAIDCKGMEEKFAFIEANLGKEIRPDSVFKQGEYVDISSITKGKGWQGIIKRYGAARLVHKATQKTRHLGTHGPVGPAKVMYTIPQPGQMGFNYRTERNKRILKIGGKDSLAEINKSAGYRNYGNARNAFIVIEGSVAGPAKRLVRVRESLSNLNAKGIKEPKITQTIR